MNSIPWNEAVTHLNKGCVGVIPTDTVYGLAARAEDPKATERLYRLKKRERKPGTLVAASTAQLNSLGIDTEVLAQAKPYWPGPISIILPLGQKLSYLHQGIGSIAMRIPANEQFRTILEQTGPLITSSANHPGAPGSVTMAQAFDYFRDQVDFYVDGGNLSDRLPSTVIALEKNGTITILRPGAGTLPRSIPRP